jgi:O-methyltransferase involved in polyketide biosynthesis
MNPSFPKFDITKPNAARMYDYALDGKDNYQADREAVNRILKVDPKAWETAHQNRAFLHRAARRVALEGVTQFIDIGSGLPTAMNTHEVVQQIDEHIRVLYVDNDPVVRAHAWANLATNKNVRVALADIREPMSILRNEELPGLIDFSRPVCLVMVAVLHFIPHLEAYRAVAQLTQAMPPDSWVIISHGTADGATSEQANDVQLVYRGTDTPLVLRSRQEVGTFFKGFQIVDPGIVNIVNWGVEKPNDDAALKVYGGVGRNGPR